VKEPEIRASTQSQSAEDNIDGCGIASIHRARAVETPGMHGNFTRENREVPSTPDTR